MVDTLPDFRHTAGMALPMPDPDRPPAGPRPPGPDQPGDEPDPTLREAQDRFVAAWGQMGSAWGISRTMAEVHALLYITGKPLCTDDVMQRLEISRGNASMSLRALLDWSIVTRTHKRGDRKEYYLAEQDVWAMFRAIVRERMKREVDPLRVSLHEIRDLTPETKLPSKPEQTAEAMREHNQRLDSMLEFLQTIDHLSERFVSPSGRGLQLAASVLNKIGPKE